MYKKNNGTVLIYSLVLVIISIFMAVSVSNVVLLLINNDEVLLIDEELENAIKEKKQYQLAYSNLVNTGGFVDNIGCPQNFSMSGTTNLSASLSGSLRYIGGDILCRAQHAGLDIDMFFNSSYTDLQTATYDGASLPINSGATAAYFSDSDATYLDLSASYPLSSDGFDDDFDNNDYISSQGYVYDSETNTYIVDEYPDLYNDNDAENRLILAGVVYPDDLDYNVFWLNSISREMISGENIFNSGSGTSTLDQSSSGRLYFNISEDYKIVIHELDSEAYDNFNEIKVVDSFYGSSQSAGNGYLQDDMTLSSSITGNELFLDFSNRDYAIFIDNNSSNVLEYTLRAEDSISDYSLYIAPYSAYNGGLEYFGNHIIVRDGALIGKQQVPEFDNFGSNDPGMPSLNGLVGWYTMSLPSYKTESGGRISEILDRSGNDKHLTQTTASNRPAETTMGITGSGFLGSYLDITNPVDVARVYAKVSYSNTTFSDYDLLLSGTGVYGSPRIMGAIGNSQLFTSQAPTDIETSVNRGVFTTGSILPLDSAVLVFDYGTPQLFSMVGGGSYSADRSWKGIIEEVLLYDTVPTATQEQDILEYLETNGERGMSAIPLTISGIVAWYDASDTSTIISTSGAVSQWDDKSGNSLHATQTVSANQPTTGVSTLNGLNVIDFDTDFLELPDLSSYINGSQDRTIIMVHRNDTSGRISFSLGENASIERYTLRSSGSNARLEFSGAGSTTSLDVSSESILTIRQSGATIGDIDMFRNGGTPYAILGTNTVATDSSIGNHIGARDGTTSYLQGTVQEVILYDNSISDSDMNSLGNYLADKWGLSWTDL